MSFFSPMHFLFLLGTIPIIIMYLLKKRHQDFEISSTFLWQRAVADIEANAPWQRLRKNILLILQLLAFIMLVFFLVKPYLISSTLDVDNLIVVLDKSLSMGTLEDSKSRFERSKEDIDEIIDNLKSNGTLTLITMGSTPDVIINKSGDKSVLSRKLKDIDISNEADNPEDTLSLIKAMTKDLENYRIIFYTDKNIDMDNAIVKNTWSNQSNVLIESLSCKQVNNSISALVQVRNYGNTDVKTDLIIYSEDEIYDVKEVELKANDSKKIYIEGMPMSSIVKAELDVEDALMADNIRYSVVRSNQLQKVLFTTSGNVFLEKAIALNENIELYKTNEVLSDVSGYDLYIYDGLFPKELPKDGNIFILNPNTLEGVVDVSGSMNQGDITIHDDDLLRYVNFDISMSKVKALSQPGWAKPFMFSNDKAIALKGEKENQRFVIVGFDIHDTDFPLKYDFPIFVQNVLDYTLSFNTQRKTEVLSGEDINIDVSPKSSEVYVETPDRNRRKVGPPFPVAAFTDTDGIGVYTIEQIIDDKVNKNFFASNVNTIKESNVNQSIRARDKLNTENNVKEKGMKNLKNIFLVLALLLLVVEWVVYNRGY
ncbi:BatA and WFA domain-containing protein [Wukongibacter baidiensis]|uniref:vWA domain-containing protein n=1 Tax=Wukongibacter baidiensis TaxID=1723361 RepID=UPI003D7F8A4E